MTFPINDDRFLSAFLLALAITVALVVPDFAEPLRPFVLPALFLVVVFSLLPLSPSPAAIRRGLDMTGARILVWQQFFLPSIVFVLGVVTGLDSKIVILLLISATASSVFSSPLFAGLLNLDNRRSVQVMIYSTFCMPFSLFVFLYLLFGPDVTFDLVVYAERVLLFLVLPLALVFAYSSASRGMAATARGRVERLARWISVVALAVFGMGLMDYVNNEFAANPAKVISYFAISITIGGFMMASTYAVMRVLGANLAKTAGMLAAFRNVGLSFALIGGTADTDLLVYIGVAQIPMFVAPFLVRLVFERKPETLEA